MQNTQASYPRVCTHESQSFSTELLESKGTGSEHLPQSHHLKFIFLLCISLLFFQLSYPFHTTAQFSKSRLLLRFEIDMSDNIYAALFVRLVLIIAYASVDCFGAGGLGDDNFLEPAVHVFAGGILVAPQFFL